MKFLYRLVLLLLLTAPAAYAQKGGYTTGAGLRAGGYSSGLTVKHFLSGKNNVAFEGLLTREYAARGGRLTLLLEKHMPVSDIKGLQFYYGAGGHVGSYNGRYYFADRRYYSRNGRGYYIERIDRYEDRNYIAFGADLIVGLEYKLPDLPFVVGVDYKPFFEVFDGYTGLYSDAAFSLRFAF